MCRRSASSFVSPGPRVPMPPPSRDSQSPEPTSRGIRYLSCASSTWSWPSRVRARRAKMSRISCVRSRTAMPGFLLEVAQLRRAQLVVDDDEIDVQLGARLRQHPDLAAAQVERGVGRGPLLDETQHDIRAGGAGQTVELFEAVLGGRTGDDAGGETDERRALPPAAFLAAGHRLESCAGGRGRVPHSKAIYRRNSNTRSKAIGPSRMSLRLSPRSRRRWSRPGRRATVPPSTISVDAGPERALHRRRRWPARASPTGWRSSP